MIGRTLLAKYELAERIADGPFFAYHAARDRLTGRTVGVRLIKEPFGSHEGFVASVRRCVEDLDFESEALERLWAVEEDEGERFIVGDLPSGSLLTDRIRVFAPFSVPLALGVAIGVCEGLRTLHAMGIVHGDVGPHNVVATHGGGARLQLGGFWRAYRGDRTSAYAALDQMAPYLAPELVEGNEPGPQSDFYALGVLLFELLTKKLPFKGDNALATASRHAAGAIPSARGLNPSVPPAIDGLIARLLDKRPANRPADADGLLTELNLLRDQLRFGKAPRPAGAVAGVRASGGAVEDVPDAATTPRRGKAKAPAPGQIAPDMSALGREAERPKRPERDVPAWILWLIVILLGAFLGLIAAWVILSFQKPKELDVPDVRGLSVAEATSLIQGRKLRLRVAEKIPSETVDADHVVSSRPAPKDRIREGGTVYVRVSLGKEQVTVPSLKGRTVDEARQVLRSLNLDIDGTPIRQLDSQAVPGTIVTQLPPVNKRVRRFSRVRVWIAAPPGAPPESLPGEKPSGPPAAVYKIDVRLTDATGPVKVRIDLEDAKGVRTVYEEEGRPDDTIARSEVGYGDDVTFRIYYDGELRKEIKGTSGLAPKRGGGKP